MIPTEEQKDIISTPVAPGEVMLMQAFAGAGKTSTLKLYAEAYPQKKFLYLAFNKPSQVEAQSKMPRNVTCRTTHALAFAEKGRPYQAKLGEPKAKEIMRFLGIKRPVNAIAVIGTVNNYLRSKDKTLGLVHVPDGHERMPLEWKDAIVVAARKLWNAMQDVKLPVPMSHDGYLKLWQLSSIDRLPSCFDSFDAVLLDEAQDTNPTVEYVLGRLLSNGRHALLLVGDERQSINQWRGAINMMGRMGEGIKTGLVRGARKSLTESFRFGADIASVASVVMNLHSEVPVKLTGRGKPGPIRTKAVLGRTNGALIADAIETIKEDPSVKLHFAGTDESNGWSPVVPYKFEFMQSLYALSVGARNQVKDPYIAQFESYAEAQAHAKGGDVELGLAIRAISKYGAELPSLLHAIVARCEGPEGAKCYSTAHRSKGLEWDEVTLLDDFPKFSEAECEKGERGRFTLPSLEEGNLAYVAVTRARQHVILNSDLKQVLCEHYQRQSCDDEQGVRV